MNPEDRKEVYKKTCEKLIAQKGVCTDFSNHNNHIFCRDCPLDSLDCGINTVEQAQIWLNENGYSDTVEEQEDEYYDTDIFDMHLHESKRIAKSMYVYRVASGWIYYQNDEAGIFVPYIKKEDFLSCE